MAETRAEQIQTIDDYEPSTGGVVHLRALSRAEAEDRRAALADLFAESSVADGDDAYDTREGFLRRLTEDSGRPGFETIIAEATAGPGEASVLVGAVFGFPVPPDGSWWLGFHGPLPHRIAELTAAGDVFAVTDLLVHRHERERGLAGHLQRRLLAGHQPSVGVTLVSQSDLAGYASLYSWGWQDIGEFHLPPDVTVRRALTLTLTPGEPAAEDPDGLAQDAEQPHEADGADPGAR
ncbi:hypothetical protein [Streptomyces sp. NBC_01190]|uniref:hypothetical protein n=1 Tax=Streptomyces sp. NBC_01190 TaxID=2903767 RepID=UPI00386D51E7|nr:hypothetical protein OG519_31010 [Streptomyces sp. NBC_01190]